SALSVPLRPADVTGAWAGLRPLLANVTARNRRASERTADLSRRHQVLVSPSGLVTVTGGKLTTYRKMAEDTVGAVTEQLGREQRRSPTRRMRLRGAGRRGARPERWGGRAEAGSTYRKSGADLAVSDATLGHLEGRYGSETPAVLGLAEGRPELLEPLVKGLAYLKVEALYGVGYEMASTLEDVLARRTRALLLDASACAEAAFGVARLIGAELGWDSRRADEEASSFVATVTADLACICRDSRVEL
ncbi:MAG: glycerol-3-phosphate dehydrogenase C-terminal domain-containing protein, partial [Acidimicrobiales bacterium]